jgi:hypothetical protein
MIFRRLLNITKNQEPIASKFLECYYNIRKLINYKTMWIKKNKSNYICGLDSTNNLLDYFLMLSNTILVLHLQVIWSDCIFLRNRLINPLKFVILIVSLRLASSWLGLCKNKEKFQRLFTIMPKLNTIHKPLRLL